MTGAGPEISFARESWTGERRVTCDLDDARPLEVVAAVCGLRDAGAHDVESRVSASGNGAHVRAWFDADEVDAEAVETLRLAHGDHPRRTWMDREHTHKPQQVLFTSKGDREAGPWRRDVWLTVDELQRRADHL
jgi:hypothetical protein